MPSPVEALPWGSRSMTSTCSPMAARAVPRLMAVVVLPTPPFWLEIDRKRRGSGAAFTDASLDDQNPARRIGQARLQAIVESPRLLGLGDFGVHVPALQEH